MKKLILKIVQFSFLFVPLFLLAQDFQGKAYYQSKTTIDLKMENDHMSEEQAKMMQEMLKKQFEKSFVLTFDKEASIYKQEEQLDKPTGGSSVGVQMIMIGSSVNEKLYKNTKTKRYAREQNLFGKPFLVKDELKSQDWKLGDESKMIGKYLCFKATAVREVKRMEFESKHSEDEKSDEVKEEMEEQKITAWYTSDIPVNHGPDNYWGLPGLIMELNVDETQYMCTKIVMNSKDKIEIKEPTKGKVINSKKFNELMEKKMKEMEINRGRESRGDGNRINIQIGG
ncbi:MAG: GLPGLI family protein [Lutibacter sp.]|nr:MAG: GLPGLI family protein [Lutibacter sp.]